MTRFRDQVARDRAWARYFARRGLRPATRDTKQQPNAFRLAAYYTRRAMSQTVKF